MSSSFQLRFRSNYGIRWTYGTLIYFVDLDSQSFVIKIQTSGPVDIHQTHQLFFFHALNNKMNVFKCVAGIDILA